MARSLSSTLVALFALSFVADSAGQGVQTGSIRGVVKDASGQIVPHVTIHADAPAQQGARMTISDEAGAYQIVGLAPGDYVVHFELSGFQSVMTPMRVTLGAIERLDVTLRPAVNETVVVTAEGTPSLLSRRGGGSNIGTA